MTLPLKEEAGSTVKSIHQFTKPNRSYRGAFLAQATSDPEYTKSEP